MTECEVLTYIKASVSQNMAFSSRKMILVLLTLLAISHGVRSSCDNDSIFPSDFKFGAGSSAYQIEGAWNETGKGRSFWDWFMNLYPLANGNTADDSYHKYKEDVAALKEIGLDFYRFSLSWPRILPNGFSNEINQDGVDYYNNLFDELEAAGIEPLVTIFHWDIPMEFLYLGGWTNPNMVDYFVDFADLAFRLFGDRVKLWATINEPKSFCELIPTTLQGYAFPELPIGTYEYMCAHYALLAHAKAYRLYQRKYKLSQGGRIGLVMNFDLNIPLTDSAEDLEAADRANQFDIGWFADPLVYGDYPQLMRDIIDRNSANQNFSRSRLPSFTLLEKLLLRGAYDVFMFNSYTSPSLVTTATYDNTPSYDNDKQVTTSVNASWPVTIVGFTLYPAIIRNTLNYLKEKYNNPEILITENGYADSGGLNDTDRIAYIQDILQEIQLARCEDDVNVTHYTYWSIMDSFEWNSGYMAKFGLVQIDYNSTNLTRTLRESAYYYSDVIQTRVP